MSKRGSNQYKKRVTFPLWKVSLFWMLILLVVIVVLGYLRAHPDKIISPIPDPSIELDVVYASDYAPDDPRREIVRVFGVHSDKAFRLLECENKPLNPRAKNKNRDGSVDLGIFQINSYWHGFNKGVNNERYLFDPAINTAIAWRIYEGSGYSFKMWTCGRKLSI